MLRQKLSPKGSPYMRPSARSTVQSRWRYASSWLRPTLMYAEMAMPRSWQAATRSPYRSRVRAGWGMPIFVG